MWCGTRTRSTWRRGSTSRWAWWAGASPALSLAAAAAPAKSERHARAPLFRPPSASPPPSAAQLRLRQRLSSRAAHRLRGHAGAGGGHRHKMCAPRRTPRAAARPGGLRAQRLRLPCLNTPHPLPTQGSIVRPKVVTSVHYCAATKCARAAAAGARLRAASSLRRARSRSPLPPGSSRRSSTGTSPPSPARPQRTHTRPRTRRATCSPPSLVRARIAERLFSFRCCVLTFSFPLFQASASTGTARASRCRRCRSARRPASSPAPSTSPWRCALPYSLLSPGLN